MEKKLQQKQKFNRKQQQRGGQEQVPEAAAKTEVKVQAEAAAEATSERHQTNPFKVLQTPTVKEYFMHIQLFSF